MTTSPAFLSTVLCLTISALAFAADASPANKESGFKVPLGLQLYSLRNQFAKDVPGTLDEVHNFGIKYVELAGTYGRTPEQFKAELDSHGLKAISMHVSY